MFPKEFSSLRLFNNRRLSVTPKGRTSAISSQDAWQTFTSGKDEEYQKKWNAKKMFSKEEKKADLDADDLIDYEDIEDV